MSAITSRISNRAHGAVRASNSRGRLLFSTSQAVRGSGAFFNLGGLGASREAQYLSKERGIPRTEYNSNIHLIRSSEVDPFAPAPGSTRTATARAAARAQAEASQAEAYSQMIASRRAQSPYAPDFPWGAQIRRENTAHGVREGASGLEAQLQVLKDELAETKRALRAVLQAKAGGGRSETSMTSHLLSTAIILTAVYFIGKDISERVSGPSTPADGLIQAQTLIDEVDEATAQRRRDAPLEEQVLAESGLTSFETQPEVLEPPKRSVLSGLFWART